MSSNTQDALDEIERIEKDRATVSTALKKLRSDARKNGRWDDAKDLTAQLTILGQKNLTLINAKRKIRKSIPLESQIEQLNDLADEANGTTATLDSVAKALSQVATLISILNRMSSILG